MIINGTVNAVNLLNNLIINKKAIIKTCVNSAYDSISLFDI